MSDISNSDPNIAERDSDPGVCRPKVDSIAQQAKRGIPWLVIGNGTSQCLSFGISIVVARILVPKDFGIVAMAQVFTEASYIIGNLGIGAAVVQKKDLSEIDRQVAFFSCLVIGALLTGVLMLAAPLASRLFNNPLVAPVLMWKSLEIVLNSVTAPATGLMQRELRFKELASLDIAVLCVQGAMAVSLALTGWGVWSLVWSTVAAAAVRAVAANWLVRYRPRLVFARDALARLLAFGANLSLKNVMVIIGRNVDNLIVGRFLGDAPLGIYVRAFSLATLPRQQVHGILHQVTFSSFSRVQEDPETLRRWFVKVAGAVALMITPVMLGLALVAHDFIFVLYTSKWAAVVVPLRVLCLAGIFISITGVVGTTLESTANLRIAIVLEGAYAGIITVGCLAVARPFGIIGVAAVVLTASIASFLAYGFVLRALFQVSFGEYLGVLRLPLAIGAVMVLCLAPLQSVSIPGVGRLLLTVIAGSVLYAGLLYLFGRKRYGYLWEQLDISRWWQPGRRRWVLPVAKS